MPQRQQPTPDLEFGPEIRGELVSTSPTYNLADLWELTVPNYLDREALVVGDQRLTYAELEDGANRFANTLLADGIQPGDNVGLYMSNCGEYIMAMLGAWKVRAVPININFRYVAHELKYLVKDADLVYLVANFRFASSILEAWDDDPPNVRRILLVEDLAPHVFTDDDRHAARRLYADLWSEVVAEADPRRPEIERSGDDLYIMYTGGTTGMPKGVVWRQEDAFFACIGGGDPMRLLGPVTSPEEMLERILPQPFTTYACAPLIHAAAQWTSLSWFLCGGRVILNAGPFNGRIVWETTQDEQVGVLIVVGDAMARPLMDAWEADGPYDISQLFTLSSGGAPLSPAIKKRIQSLLPDLMLTDGYGSSETGAQGVQRLQPGEAHPGMNRFVPEVSSTTVLNDDLVTVAPGSGEIGRVARTGYIPIAYYGDEEKTAATFVEIDGVRWVLTGDAAIIEDDGTISLLGRGSACINTGGEKVFPEEVEGVLKGHPGIYDCVVAGAPDDRWGQTVVAIVSVDEGVSLEYDDIYQFCIGQLAGYKLPRRLVVVDEVVRSPVGKPDYRWAKEVAATAE